MTLLEVLVALLILGALAAGTIEVLAGTTRVASGAEEWSRAVAHAEHRMETLKIDSGPPSAAIEHLGDGFTLRVEERPWSQPGFMVVTVGVGLPGGGQHTLVRLRSRR